MLYSCTLYSCTLCIWGPNKYIRNDFCSHPKRLSKIYLQYLNLHWWRSGPHILPKYVLKISFIVAINHWLSWNSVAYQKCITWFRYSKHNVLILNTFRVYCTAITFFNHTVIRCLNPIQSAIMRNESNNVLRFMLNRLLIAYGVVTTVFNCYLTWILPIRLCVNDFTKSALLINTFTITIFSHLVSQGCKTIQHLKLAWHSTYINLFTI